MIILSRKGFTLVEIMIVVAIIALLAAIAIPNVVRARLNANEGAAMSAIRTLYTSAESFRAVATPPAYPTTVDDLSTATPPYISTNFGEAVNVQGYTYYINGTGVTADFVIVAAPTNLATTGNRSFGITSNGVLRAQISTAAVAAADTTAATVNGALWANVSGI